MQESCAGYSYAVLSVSGVVAMFGSTYNGQYEDVKAFNDKVGEMILFLLRTRFHQALHTPSAVLSSLGMS